jgi:hypothetical protein
MIASMTGQLFQLQGDGMSHFGQNSKEKCIVYNAFLPPQNNIFVKFM